MRKLKTLLLTGALLVLGGFNPAFAADVATALGTAGAWSKTTKDSGDTTKVVLMTQLTNAISSTDRVEIPSNVLNDSNGRGVELMAYPAGIVDGITLTKYTYPTPASFKLTGGTTAYTDAVSLTTSLAAVSGTTPVSDTTRVGADGIKFTAGSTISTTESVQLRLEYTVPKSCRWPKC